MRQFLTYEQLQEICGHIKEMFPEMYGYTRYLLGYNDFYVFRNRDESFDERNFIFRIKYED
jgi:hypothetical protein